MGTVQAAIAHGVLDAVRAGDIPKEKADELGIIYSVWLGPSVTEVDDLDRKALFDVHHEFPDAYGAHWVRVRASRARRATASFVYQ